MNIASNAGLTKCNRNDAKQDRSEKLLELEAQRVAMEGTGVSKQLREAKKVDVALDLVGNSTLLDSIAIPHPNGCICMVGWLGGLEPVHDFNPLHLVDRVAKGSYKAKPPAVFSFDEVREVQRLMESGKANGKITVKVSATEANLIRA